MMFDFALGLEPVIQLMSGLMVASFKKLISTFADEVWHTFNRATAGVRSIMECRNFLGRLISSIGHIDLSAVVLFQFSMKFARRGNIFHRPGTRA